MNEEESEGLKSQHAHLSQLLKEREEMIQRLEEESSFLEKQHSDVQQEVCVASVHLCVGEHVFIRLYFPGNPML